MPAIIIPTTPIRTTTPLEDLRRRLVHALGMDVQEWLLGVSVFFLMADVNAWVGSPVKASCSSTAKML